MDLDGDTFTFGLMPISGNINVETEALIYPWTSLVAEFGGALGLFIGFSFMMVWDGVEGMCRLILQNKCNNVPS